MSLIQIRHLLLLTHYTTLLLCVCVCNFILINAISIFVVSCTSHFIIIFFCEILEQNYFQRFQFLIPLYLLGIRQLQSDLVATENVLMVMPFSLVDFGFYASQFICWHLSHLAPASGTSRIIGGEWLLAVASSSRLLQALFPLEICIDISHQNKTEQ